VPSLRRRGRGEAAVAGAEATVPWALGPLLRDGPAPLEPRARRGDDVALVLGPAQDAPGGVPAAVVDALGARVVAAGDAAEASGADVVLACGWAAAPAVLTLSGVRARAVLATADPAPLAELGWAAGVPVVGPRWLGGTLPPGADEGFAPMPVHRREDLVLVHGEEPFGLLAAAELHARRPDLAFAVSGVRRDLVLPFPFLGVEAGTPALAHAFASAAVALAPPVRGWRPAALAMLACGQAVVAPDDDAARAARGDAAGLARDPPAGADAALAVIDDVALRAERVRAGLALVPGGWGATAAALAAEVAAL